MRCGIGSYTYGWAIAEQQLDAAALIDLAARHGLPVVQLADNLPASTFAPDTLAQLHARAIRAQVQLELGARGSDPAHVQAMLRLAAQVRSPILRLVIDTRDDHPDAAEIARRLRAVTPLGQSLGVTIAIENHDRINARSLAAILDPLWPAVGCCFDTANSAGLIESARAGWAALSPFIVNVHLKDIATRRLPHLQGFIIEGTRLGEGLVDLEWIRAAVAQLPRDVSVILEQWVPPEDDMASTIDKESRWAGHGIALLKHWQDTISNRR